MAATHTAAPPALNALGAYRDDKDDTIRCSVCGELLIVTIDQDQIVHMRCPTGYMSAAINQEGGTVSSSVDHESHPDRWRHSDEVHTWRDMTHSPE